MSILNKINSAAQWIADNESAIRITLDIHNKYGQAMLKDLVNLSRVVTQPKEFPKVNEVVSFIKPLLPSKKEIVENLFSNTIEAERVLELKSQVLHFLVHSPVVSIISLEMDGKLGLLKAEISINDKIVFVHTNVMCISCHDNQNITVGEKMNDVTSFAAFIDSFTREEIKKEEEANIFWETPEKKTNNNNSIKLNGSHNKHDKYPDAYDNVKEVLMKRYMHLTNENARA